MDEHRQADQPVVARERVGDVLAEDLASPIDGAVSERRASVGEYLAAGASVVNIVKLHPLRLRVAVPEREAGGVRPGQAVLVSVEGAPGEHRGRVTRLSPSIAEQSRTLLLEAEIPNENVALRPGAFAKAEIVVVPHQDGRGAGGLPTTSSPRWSRSGGRSWRGSCRSSMPPGFRRPAGAISGFEGITYVIERLAARYPLMLVLEDVHCADEMSLRLLAFVGRRLHRWRALLVVTAREEELADAAAAGRTLEEVCREGPAIHLGPVAALATGHAVEPASAAAPQTLPPQGSRGDRGDPGRQPRTLMRPPSATPTWRVRSSWTSCISRVAGRCPATLIAC